MDLQSYFFNERDREMLTVTLVKEFFFKIHQKPEKKSFFRKNKCELNYLKFLKNRIFFVEKNPFFHFFIYPQGHFFNERDRLMLTVTLVKEFFS